MKSLKVALISEEYPPFMFGGIGSACHDFAAALSKKGVQTTVFCGKSRKVRREHVNCNLEVVRLPCLEAPPRFVWFQLLNLKTLAQLLQDYSVLHVFNPQAGAAAALLKRRLKKPLVTSIHGLHLSSLKLSLDAPRENWTTKDVGFQLAGYPLQVLLHDICLRNSDHVTVCNYSTVTELKQMFSYLDSSRLSVIYNGLNFGDFDGVESNVENGESIVYCGRLYWAKGVTYFLDALQKLKGSHPDFEAQIFGDGPLRSKVESAVSARGLAPNVRVRGFVPRKQMLTEIKKAGMVVLPSLYEAQPVAVLEAMACRKPVVAFDLPFAAEIIKSGVNGFLARLGDVDDLAEKIQILVEDPKLRAKLGKNGYNYVKKNHDWDVLVEKHLEIYENLKLN
ncbi:MAG: glycosyltransferase family 4 protein [Candidatus Bathyarchaeota archaeon]|nr:glycosyltransferase family 4 protein [Candidatus Bathyarchaeota archaeon]